MSTLTTQEHRVIAVTTSLGEDVLLLKSMSGTEMLSGCFKFELELVSEQPEKVKFDDIVGQNITISLDLDGDQARFFNGCVSSFQQAASLDSLSQYRAIVVPWFWFLTRASNCRIFQNMTAPDIIKQVFRDHGYSNFEDLLTGEYPKREYCVQYRETDFNFVNRLMEEEGIYYFFKHDDKVHTLAMTDSTSKHDPYSGYQQIKYHPDDGSREVSQCVRELSIGQEVQPGVFALKSFDFEDPKNALHVKGFVNRNHAAADFEYYDYHPGTYQKSKVGETYAEIRAQEMHTKFEVVRGRTDARGLCPGHTFKLTDCRPESLNRKYLVTSCSYKIQSNVHRLGSQSDNAGPSYTADFTAIDTAQQFRPPRVTPKPTIQGPQTAIVVGKDGDEITTDKYGRVKVQFHWDRDGKFDQDSSCWIRVAQVWAGKKWGAMYIPRIGQEVIVEFLEGDPDRPIITGRVYNADKMPPCELPANKTQSTIKSDSTSGSGGSNEIRFEDKKDAEELYIHAQKDQLIEIGNNESVSVGNDRSETVGNNETISVGNDRSETVGNNETIAIGVNRTETVGSNETVTVTLMRTHSVGVNDMCNVGAAQEISVGGAQAITVGAAQALTVGAAQAITVGLNQSVNVGKDASTTIGKNDTLKVGKNLTIDAGDQILIKTGKASILMKKDGTITITGKDIKTDGSGKIDVIASKNVTIKGKKILQNS